MQLLSATRTAVGLAALLLLSGGCMRAHTHKPFTDAAQRAEAGLRELGASWFDVVSFEPQAVEFEYVADSFHGGTSLARVRYAASIRYKRNLTVPTRAETLARLRNTTSTAKEIEQGIMLRRLLGAGMHAAGSTQVLRNAAVFQEIDSGWRFVAADGVVFAPRRAT